VGCSGLVPQEWKAGVSGAELPNGGESVGDWRDAQTGKLDQANGRTVDAIGIVERCEERDRRAVKRAKRGPLSRLLSDRRGAGLEPTADDIAARAWFGGHASRLAGR
jgi:hypothetical protein